ncbi:hypothetical protein DICPUDRAFT_154608 [Dictyostelium purpureum]|uniref:Transmembrane protein 53 n=1 Tax=Dictyostelium purpureum TaxID=5786 RepID=F0ZRS4_DICPU|nr:uncharacterized protein DICPUDRAFT_154608 [Dictyostelium purpureum]EGC33369.1 hypothetical protein DICPUDRAFT_154608 [Dictyostelium purpureum]|eukprot:XP_003290120.1 hypothetical protein DICPUDRAFT_154608 [Dictyostelium purpureum]
MGKSIFQFKSADADSPKPFPQEEDKPLVVLLGWMGSKMVHLNKYGDQWRKRGFNTLSYCSNPSEILMPGAIKKKGTLMLEQISMYVKENPKCNTIIFNAMSNGGGFYYSFMIGEIHDNQKWQHLRPYVRGTVLDSLPAIRPWSVFTAFKMTSPNFLVTCVLFVLIPFVMLLFAGYMKIYVNNLQSAKNQWQHLILYSKSDIIVHSDDIDKIVMVIKDNIINKQQLDTKCWDDSPHVSHLRHHPIEYENRLNNFVESIKRHGFSK